MSPVLAGWVVFLGFVLPVTGGCVFAWFLENVWPGPEGEEER